MFTVRKQYKKDGEKHDFFIVPGLESLHKTIDGVNYIHTSVVWAARGFYAGVGSEKAYYQLVNAGLVADRPKRSMTLKSAVKTFIKNLKFLIG